MKKRHRRALGRYVRDCANLIELRDWTVHTFVGDTGSPPRPDGQTWGASSESVPGAKHVKIRFRDDVRDWDAETLRQTVAHELIHAHFAPLMEMLRVDLHPHLKRQAYDLFNDSATRWLEYGVDALADAVAPRLPLIDWPT